MLRFVVHRLVTTIPVLIGIVVVVFVLARVIPGDPCTATYGEKATPAVCAEFNHQNGLDRPIPVQLGTYMGDVATGDLGRSVSQGRTVSELLIERMPVTIELAVNALIFAVAVGIPLGVIAAYRRGSAADVASMIGANFGVSMPVFWLGLMLQFIFAQQLGWLPPSGRLPAGVISTPFYEKYGWGENGVFEFLSNFESFNALITGQWSLLWDATRYMILPAIALGTIPLAIVARMTRSSLLDNLGLDYVRTARAKGLREFLVVRRHAMRNSLLPVVTVIGLSMGALVGGAVLTETIFNLTGVGKTLFDAITARDYAVVQGFTLVIAVAFVLVNLLTDIVYTFLDPRVRVT
jgi:peptide/nickel transport system permease protein